jgi:hypothetical protein
VTAVEHQSKVRAGGSGLRRARVAGMADLVERANSDVRSGIQPADCNAVHCRVIRFADAVVFLAGENRRRQGRRSAREGREDRGTAVRRFAVEGFADVAQLVEHSLGKGEVTSSILVIGSRDHEVEIEIAETGIRDSDRDDEGRGLG